MTFTRCAIILLTCLFGLASAERCVRHHTRWDGSDYDTYTSCSNGCCYTWIYPCCDDYTTSSDTYKIAGAVSASLIFIGLVIALLIIRRRRYYTQSRTRVVIPTVSANVAVSNQNHNHNQTTYGAAASPYGAPPTCYNDPRAKEFQVSPPAYATNPPPYSPQPMAY